jgi:hypothetical protein
MVKPLGSDVNRIGKICIQEPFSAIVAIGSVGIIDSFAGFSWHSVADQNGRVVYETAIR